MKTINEPSDSAEIIRREREKRSVQLFIAGLGKIRMREIALQHGRDWEKMSEKERDAFVFALLHENS
jgi:hypothetical protein